MKKIFTLFVVAFLSFAFSKNAFADSSKVLISRISHKNGAEFIELKNFGADFKFQKLEIIKKSATSAREDVYFSTEAGVFRANSSILIRELGSVGEKDFESLKKEDIPMEPIFKIKIDDVEANSFCGSTISRCAELPHFGKITGDLKILDQEKFLQSGEISYRNAKLEEIDAAPSFGGYSIVQENQDSENDGIDDSSGDKKDDTGESDDSGGNSDSDSDDSNDDSGDTTDDNNPQDQTPPAPKNTCQNLKITEIYANSDEQFVELYNNSESEISLKGCTVSSSARGSKDFVFENIKLTEKGFYVLNIKDTELKISKTAFTNIFLLDEEKNEIQSVKIEKTAKFSSLSFFEKENSWKQTFKITSNSENIFEEFLPCEVGFSRNEATNRCVKDQEAVEITEKKCAEGYFLNEATKRCNKIIEESPKVCAEGYFLNLSTNRCNKIVENLPKVCAAGYFLNEITNRCNKIAASSTSLIPCRAGYYRSEETGRCRKIQEEKTTELTPCKEGYERNPETNRCRKIVKNTGATNEVEKTSESTEKKFSGWWAIITVIVLILAVIIWEFRKSLARFFAMIFRGKNG